MNLVTMALNHLRRRKARTAFLAMGLTIGVAVIVAVISTTLAMQVKVNRKLNQYGANILVMPKTLDVSANYGGITVTTVATELEELTEQDAMLIATIKRNDALRVISPKLVGAVEVDGRRVMIQGIQFRQEIKLKPWWELQGTPPSRSRDIVLGSSLAKEIGRKEGDSLPIGGKDFRVTGILTPQLSQDDSSIFADLRETGLLLNKPGKVSLIEVSAWCILCPVETLSEQIEEKLPKARVWAVKQAWEAQLSTYAIFTTFAVVLGVVIFLVGSLILGITMMASVNERTREIGVLRAVGFRQSHVMSIILLEGLLISLVSGFLGDLLGSVLSVVLPLLLGEEEVEVLLDPALLLGAMVLAVATGTLASLYPARRAAHLDPVTALRAL